MAKRTSTNEVAQAKRRTPDMATQETGANHPFISATPPYYWTFHPERWTVVAGKLVPSLMTSHLISGVNNVEIDRNGSVRFANARAKLEEQGITLIPWNWAPDGISYLQCLDTRPGGTRDAQEAWISVFESADVGGQETSCDEEAYAEWLSSLVATGKLPGCSANVARKMLDAATERLEKARADAAKLGGHGGASIRAKALEVEVKVLAQHVKTNQAEKAQAKQRAMPSVDAQEQT